MLHELKCVSCSHVLGEYEAEHENIVSVLCTFCIHERQQFKWIFSGISEQTDRKDYWTEREKFFPISTSTSDRKEESLELDAFIKRLYWLCDKELDNE